MFEWMHDAIPDHELRRLSRDIQYGRCSWVLVAKIERGRDMKPGHSIRRTERVETLEQLWQAFSDGRWVWCRDTDEDDWERLLPEMCEDWEEIEVQVRQTTDRPELDDSRNFDEDVDTVE